MALVTVIVGSATDRPVVDPTLDIFAKFKIDFELRVSSAHRDPDRTAAIVKESEESGTRVFIAAAGIALQRLLMQLLSVPISSLCPNRISRQLSS